MAPCEMRVSTSVNCCSLLRLASASMYLPPASSIVFWMFGLSCAAQRGCWKLFHETPTVQSAGAADAAVAATLRRRCRRCCARLCCSTLLEQAAAIASVASERRHSSISYCVPPPVRFHSSSKCSAVPARLPPSLSRPTSGCARDPDDRRDSRDVSCPPSCTGRLDGRRRGTSQPAGSARAARRRAPLHRAAAHRLRASPARRAPTPRGAASARRSSSCSSGGPHEWMDPPEEAAKHDQLGVEDVDSPARPIPSQWPTWSRALSAAGEPVSASSSIASTSAAAASGRSAGHAQQGGLTDLGLPAADRATAAGRPVRVDRQVPDLSAIARGTCQRLAVDDQSATDAVLARR